MVSELQFARELVPGTYRGPDGQLLCHDVIPTEAGLLARVQLWRTKIPEVFEFFVVPIEVFYARPKVNGVTRRRP